jgi:hypothetical protein
MFGLCKYRNALGNPGKGVHRFRIANIAIVDVLLTCLLAYSIHVVFGKYNYLTILYFCFMSGIILHRIFCVKTTIDKFLFG